LGGWPVLGQHLGRYDGGVAPVAELDDNKKEFLKGKVAEITRQKQQS